MSLLRKVAEKAVSTLGGAAGQAFEYLRKNTPQVVDRVMESTPGTRPFSQRGQSEMTRAGKLLQKAPDTSIAPPKFISQTPLSSLFGPLGNETVAKTITSIPGEVTRSWGRSLERAGTPEGRAKTIEGAKKLPKQTKELFTGGVKNLPQNALDLIENPAIEDALNATDLFTLGAGTAMKLGGKKVAKEAVEQGVKAATKTGTKELFEKAGKPMAKTIVKEASEEAPSVIKSTKKLFTKPGEATAAVKTKTAQIFKKGTDIAREWIDTREGYTNFRSGDIKKTPALTQFDKEGMDAIIDLQSGKNAPRYKAIKSFTDGLFKLEEKAGLLRPDQYRKSYLPQMWENTPEQIDDVFKRVAGKKPGFAKSRLLEDYKTGIDAGLTPRFNTISDLLSSRYKTAQRALADNDMVKNLIKSGQGMTLDKAPVGWQKIDMMYDGKPIAVSPETAKIVNAYLGQGSALLAKTAEFVSNAKQTILSAGIPRTGWNFHTGVNVPARAAAVRSNPFGAMVDSVIWNTNPKSAVNYVEKVVPKDVTDGLLKQGLTITRSVEEGGYGFKPREGKSTIAKIRTGFDKLFSEVAFDQVLPAHKLKVGWETYQKALKNGATQDEAFKIGADTANTVFGGVNPAELGRSKDFQNVLRTFLLAPDWLESNVRIAGKMGGLLNPENWKKAEFAPYKTFARNATAMYTSFAMTNKALSGHWPWQNGAGQEFNLATGSFDERGRERVISAFGTAFDFIRIPLTMVTAAVNNDPQAAVNVIKNRLSPPVSSTVALMSNQDYRGREIMSPDKSIAGNVAGVAGQVGNAVGIPSQVTNTLALLRGEATPEELGMNLLEAPVRYRGGAKSPSQRKTAELLKQGGATNQEVNQAFSSQPAGKGGISSWFGGGAPKVETDSSGKVVMPKTKKEQDALNKAVDTALENGSADLPDNIITARFFKGKTYDKSARSGQQDILDAALKVADDEYLTPEQKAKIVNAAKIDSVDLQYYRVASMDQNDRLEGLLEFASAEHKDRGQFIEDLILGKRGVGGKSMFSTTMYDRLYDEGLISKDEKALISAVKYDPVFNKFYMDRDYDGGAGESASKIKSYVKSINALFKKTIKSTDKGIAALAEEINKPMETPKLSFPKAPKQSGKTAQRWFTAY